MREGDGVKYGLSVEASRGQVMRAFWQQLMKYVSLIYSYLLCWVSMFFLEKYLLDISIDSNQAVPESIARIILK